MLFETFPKFLNYCRSLSGETLHAEAQNKPFTVEVEGKALWFIPLSSGKRRRANPEKVERVLSLLKTTGKGTPSSYRNITYHASYIIAVANRYATIPA